MWEVITFFVCAVLAVLMGETVDPTLKALRRKIPIPKIPGNEEIQKAWQEAIKHPNHSGAWIGRVERIAFFFALYFGSVEAIGLWLAFKVASKWEAWSNLGYTPPDLFAEESPLQQLQYSAARRAWAAQSYATFVVGTGINFACAGVGISLFHLYPRLQEILRAS